MFDFLKHIVAAIPDIPPSSRLFSSNEDLEDDPHVHGQTKEEGIDGVEKKKKKRAPRKLKVDVENVQEKQSRKRAKHVKQPQQDSLSVLNDEISSPGPSTNENNTDIKTFEKNILPPISSLDPVIKHESLSASRNKDGESLEKCSGHLNSDAIPTSPHTMSIEVLVTPNDSEIVPTVPLLIDQAAVEQPRKK